MPRAVSGRLEAAVGRHSRRSSTPPRHRRSLVVVPIVVFVIALVGWFTVDVVSDRLRAADCPSRPVVTVAAAPDIAATIGQVAEDASGETGEGAGCYQVRVTSRESAEVAEALTVSDGTQRPDVWIPESTLWLRRAEDRGAWTVPVTGTSIASSPVVLAVTEMVASELGWPERPPAWQQVLGPGVRPLAVGLPDPARDPVGVSALLGLRDLVADTPDPRTALTAAMRALSRNTVVEQADLFARLPGSTDPDGPLEALVVSENALLRHNATQDRVPLVAVYADPVVPALDYPYVALPDTPADQRAAAERFLERVQAQHSADLLADAGFRTPDGAALRDRSQNLRTSPERMFPAPPPGTSEVEQVLARWAGVNLSGRLQVLLDVSGSMAEQVPGTGQSRMAVTVQAAAAGLGMFKPTTKLGMWLFSTDLDGDKDYQVLLPVRPMAEHLAGGVLDVVRGIETLPAGNTALYDTVLAAYQDSVRNWEPGRINTVVVMTDGKDDNASTITLDRLVAELAKLQDPRRPLKLIGIGIGPDVDRAELTAIAQATGGQAFVATNPAMIGAVFHEALSLMLCQSQDCRAEAGR